MGFFSSIKKAFGGGGGSKNKVSNANQTVIKNTSNISIENDLHLEELGQSLESISKEERSLTSGWYEYLKEQDTEEEQEKKKDQALKLLALKQNAEGLEQSKKNTKYTIIFAVIGIILTVWQMKKKGKK